MANNSNTPLLDYLLDKEIRQVESNLINLFRQNGINADRCLDTLVLESKASIIVNVIYYRGFESIRNGVSLSLHYGNNQSMTIGYSDPLLIPKIKDILKS